MSPRFVVLDQNLRTFEGHYHDYDSAVIEAAVGLGLDAVVVSHEAFPGTSLAGAPIVGRVAASTIEANRPGAVGYARDILATLPGPARHLILRSLGLVRHRTAPPRTLVHLAIGLEVRRLIDELALDAADHIFAHTIGASEVMGLAEELSRASALPRIHLVLRYDMTQDMRDALNALASADREHQRVRLWTDSELLGEHFAEFGVEGIEVLPVPHCIPQRWREVEPQEGGTLALGYLGGARREKGFDLLPGLVDELEIDFFATGRVRLVAQADYAISRDEPLMSLAKRRLASYPPGWVQLLDGPLPPREFLDALASTDLLLLPYRHEEYRHRTSGLLVQAATIGLPTVIPSGTWLSAEAPVGASVTFDAPERFASSVRLALGDHVELCRAARSAAASFRASHSAERLLERLLGRA